jgi:hypothetical protein
MHFFEFMDVLYPDLRGLLNEVNNLAVVLWVKQTKEDRAFTQKNIELESAKFSR